MRTIENEETKKPKILIPTNFTGHAVIAGEYAVRMFEGLSCTYILETVFSSPGGSAGTLIKISDIVMRSAADSLRKEREEIEFGHKDIHLQTKVEEGEATTVIGKSVKREKADLLVIGHNSHVKKFLSTFLESPDTWPALLVPNRQFAAPAKDAICICSPESGQAIMNPAIAAIEKRIEAKSGKIYFTENEQADTLKKQLNSALRKGTPDLIIFKAERGSELEGIIKMHLLDEILLIRPVLLLSC